MHLQKQLSLLIASCIAACPVAADAKGPTIVELHLSPAEGVDFDSASTRLRLGIHQFLDSMPQSVRDEFAPFQVPASRSALVGIEALRNRWSANRNLLAVVSSSVGGGQNGGGYSAVGSVYIGASNLHLRIQAGGDSYFGVDGFTEPSPARKRLQMYQLIIGYALLLRAWQVNHALVPAIAQRLRAHAASMVGTRWGGLDCRTKITSAIDKIVAQAGSRAASERATSPERRVECTAQ